jgi:hypothetical protein
MQQEKRKTLMHEMREALIKGDGENKEEGYKIKKKKNLL